MLTNVDVEALLARLSLPDKGKAMVRQVRQGEPARQHTQHLKNTLVDFFSVKMGRKHLRLGSHTVEAAAAQWYEFDPAILEYWPQPIGVDLLSVGADGRPRGRQMHWPDFLVITQTEIRFEEWREEARLNALAERGGFSKDDVGTWHYRAAETYFAEFGLTHQTHSAIELPRVLIDNSHVLSDYHRPNCPPLPADLITRLQNALRDAGHIDYLDLIALHGFKADEVLRAIVEGHIHVDLTRDRLTKPQELVVFRDSALSKAHEKLHAANVPPLPFPGMAQKEIGPGCVFNYSNRRWTVMLVGAGQVLVKAENGDTTSLELDDLKALPPEAFEHLPHKAAATVGKLATLSSKELQIAVARLEQLEGKAHASSRTIRRWKVLVEGCRTRVDQICALAGKARVRGNRTPRLPEKVVAIATDTITTFYNTPTCPTKQATYNKYVQACGDAKEPVLPMSYWTFCGLVDAKSSIEARKGKRVAYQESPIPLHLDLRHPIHGMFPHDVCYIDHTVLNLATTGTNNQDLGKPYLTLAVDGTTTQCRAYWVSYDPPSAAVVLLILRDYVRRNARLPKILVVDGGREFRGKELALFCKLYEIDLRHRPPGQPRGGSLVERMFGSTEIEFIAQLEGNTLALKEARQVTKSVDPFRRREWTLTALHGALDEYFTLRHNRVHSTLGISPNDFERKAVAEFGARTHCIVPFDENIMLATCPHPKQSMHKVIRGRGVWVDGQHYWNDAFRSARRDERVEVRVEPWSTRVIYVHYRGTWVAAIDRNVRDAHNFTRHQLELQIRHERRLAKANGRKGRFTVAHAKQMTKLWDPKNYDPRIQAQQDEAKYLAQKLGMAYAMDVSALLVLPPASESPVQPVLPQAPKTNALVVDVHQSNNHSLWGADSELI